MTKVRVRFAPSPTGPLHIGGIRTALYNYLFAKQQNGRFILRIEDTDQARFVPGAEEYIIEALKWVGLNPDEGQGIGGDYQPYRQSERQDIYHKHALDLIQKGFAYYAFDTPEEIEAMKAKFISEGVSVPKYDFNTRSIMRNSLTLDKLQADELLNSGVPYVIRLKVPNDEVVEIIDKIRGHVRFATEELDDKILIKSDGLPTYHMANVVDDRLMKITHVIRGEEWLSSTAHHVLLYRYFGWESEMPEFAHLPLILKPNGHGKLSKRDGAQFGFPVFPLDWIQSQDDVFSGFREAGFLPEALLNFLAFLGWNPGTEKELYTLEELIQDFSIDHIVKSGARFDYEKAKWFNQQHIQRTSDHDLQYEVIRIFKANYIDLTHEQALQIVSLYKERIVLLTDFYHQGRYLVQSDLNYNIDFKEKKWKSEWTNSYQNLTQIFDSLESWNQEVLEPVIKQFISEYQYKMGDVLPTLRVMLSGIPTGPDIYKMLISLGREQVILRIEKGITSLNSK